jgi:hypothetical protein
MIPARFVACTLFVSIFSIAALSCSGEKAEKPAAEQYVDRLGKAKKDAEKAKADVEKAAGAKLEEANKALNEATKSLGQTEKKAD